MELRLIAEKLFDDYFFVGHQTEGFHILKTDGGLVLFDSMGLPEADEKYLLPGLRALGLEGEPIHTLFLTHGHFDHYLGADHVWRRTGCQVALSKEDCVFMVNAPDNRDKDPLIPRITMLVKDGETYSFGSHSVYVMEAPGHTPGCLNYSFPVHDHGQEHRALLFGGYAVFGPNCHPVAYPYSAEYAVEQAAIFAATCVKTWAYCKENRCDVYINPHPNLCDLLELAEKNRSRSPGTPNALVIGVDGVRKWLLDRFDACLASMQKFTDIGQPCV